MKPAALHRLALPAASLALSLVVVFVAPAQARAQVDAVRP